MIVLDEHLQEPSIAQSISGWYRGKVCVITELRPGSVIKDDAVPALLRKQPEPTFVTLDVNHFWERVEAHPGYCVVCFTLTSSQAAQVSPLLRRLFKLPQFAAKAARKGKVIRVAAGKAFYYAVGQREPQELDLPSG